MFCKSARIVMAIMLCNILSYAYTLYSLPRDNRDVNFSTVIEGSFIFFKLFLKKILSRKGRPNNELRFSTSLSIATKYFSP